MRAHERGAGIKKVAIALGSLTAIFALGNVSDARSAQRAADAGKNRIEAVANLRAFPGQTARGLARLTARPGHPPGILAVLIGIAVDPSDPTGNTVYLGLSRRSCRELRQNPDAIEGSLQTLGKPLEVSNGAALMEREGLFNAQQLRRARSLAFFADLANGWVVAACGRLTKARVASGQPTKGTKDVLWADAAYTGKQFGGARFLANITAGDQITLVTGAAAFVGLEPSTRYGLGLSRRSCRQLGTETAGRAPITRVGGLRTDTVGNAHAVIKMQNVLVRSLRRARSMVVTTPAPNGLIIVICGRVLETDLVEF